MKPYPPRQVCGSFVCVAPHSFPLFKGGISGQLRKRQFWGEAGMAQRRAVTRRLMARCSRQMELFLEFFFAMHSKHSDRCLTATRLPQAA